MIDRLELASLAAHIVVLLGIAVALIVDVIL